PFLLPLLFYTNIFSILSDRLNIPSSFHMRIIMYLHFRNKTCNAPANRTKRNKELIHEFMAQYIAQVTSTAILQDVSLQYRCTRRMGWQRMGTPGFAPRAISVA